MGAVGRFLRAIKSIVGWLNLPGDIRGLWEFIKPYVLPVIGAALIAAVAWFREAPLWQIAGLTVAVFVLIYVGIAVVDVVKRRVPLTDTPPSAATQERWRAQDAPISSLPEPPLGATDEPFSLEPVKRRGPLKPDGERDIYMSIRVTNEGSGWLRGCRGRLLRIQEFVSTPDGHEWRDIPHIHPALLRWSPGDGGGDSTDFTTEATLDVAVIESWAEPVYQLLTANESLRSTYQLEYGLAGPKLTFEVAAESGGCIEQAFSLDGHIRDFLETPTEVEPVVKWQTWP